MPGGEASRRQPRGGRVPAGHRALPGQQLVEHDAEGVEVAAAVELGGPEVLGRRIPRLAEEDAGRGEGAVAGQHFGDAQVDQLDLRPAVRAARQHEIVGSDVAVHETMSVQVAHGGKGLAGDLQGQADRRRSARAQQLLERQAGDELHDDEGIAVLADGEIVQGRDVRMPQPVGELRLAQEAPGQLGVGLEVGADHLDDADLVKEAMADLVDRTHPALADLVEDLVLAFELFFGQRHPSSLLQLLLERGEISRYRRGRQLSNSRLG
jgi:hypothetical protein